MVKRIPLDTLDIASRLKARNPSTWANQFKTNLDVDKLVSIIAVANLKGGVGKSTIAVNLACELAKHQKVVVIDADLQGTASSWAEQDRLPVEVNALPLEADTDIENWVKQVLGQKADHVVIDCPPHVGPSTFGAIGISDMTLVPVMPSGTDLLATVPAIRIIRAAQSTRRDRGPLCLLVPSRVDRRTAAGREIEATLKTLGEPVSPCVRQRTALVDAFSTGTWIGEFAPGSDSHEDIKALATTVKRRWLMELRQMRDDQRTSRSSWRPPRDNAAVDETGTQAVSL